MWYSSLILYWLLCCGLVVLLGDKVVWQAILAFLAPLLLPVVRDWYMFLQAFVGGP